MHFLSYWCIHIFNDLLGIRIINNNFDLQNYNKSRIHSYRGAKDVIITLDQTEIFKGEIERACGGTEGGTEAFGDVSLSMNCTISL